MLEDLNKFSALGLGTSHLSSLGRSINLLEAKTLFDTALAMNVTTIDTSDTYGSGDSERLIGRAIHDNRQDFQIITKAGFPYLHLPSYLSPLNQIGKKLFQKAAVKKCYSKNYLINSLEKSLNRLQTDYVDAFVLHEPIAAELIEYDDFWEGLELIKKRGMAKYIGISTNDPAAFRIASENIELDLTQTAMPYGNNKENSVFYLAKKNNIPVILNQVLQPYKSLLEIDEIRDHLKKLGKKDTDLRSVLLSYVINYKKADCALIGTRSPEHLIQNVEGFHQNNDFKEMFEEISKIAELSI
jgi:pyridoxine 4-dehydrogenase